MAHVDSSTYLPSSSPPSSPSSTSSPSPSSPTATELEVVQRIPSISFYEQHQKNITKEIFCYGFQISEGEYVDLYQRVSSLLKTKPLLEHLVDIIIQAIPPGLKESNDTITQNWLNRAAKKWVKQTVERVPAPRFFKGMKTGTFSTGFRKREATTGPGHTDETNSRKLRATSAVETSLENRSLGTNTRQSRTYSRNPRNKNLTHASENRPSPERSRRAPATLEPTPFESALMDENEDVTALDQERIGGAEKTLSQEHLEYDVMRPDAIIDDTGASMEMDYTGTYGDSHNEQDQDQSLRDTSAAGSQFVRDVNGHVRDGSRAMDQRRHSLESSPHTPNSGINNPKYGLVPVVSPEYADLFLQNLAKLSALIRQSSEESGVRSSKLKKNLDTFANEKRKAQEEQAKNDAEHTECHAMLDFQKERLLILQNVRRQMAQPKFSTLPIPVKYIEEAQAQIDECSTAVQDREKERGELETKSTDLSIQVKQYDVNIHETEKTATVTASEVENAIDLAGRVRKSLEEEARKLESAIGAYQETLEMLRKVRHKKADRES